MRMTLVVSAVAAGLAGGVAVASEGAIPPVPVMVGGEPNLDACGATGLVVGLRGGRDSYLAVRSGPGLGFKQVDRLRLKTRVWICESRTGWLGVVYGSDDCGVSAPSPARTAYPGSCASGWVSERYVHLEAG